MTQLVECPRCGLRTSPLTLTLHEEVHDDEDTVDADYEISSLTDVQLEDPEITRRNSSLASCCLCSGTALLICFVIFLAFYFGIRVSH